MKSTTKNRTKKAVKPAPVAPESKPQIPTMLAALRRSRNRAQAFVDELETKLAVVLRPATAMVGSAAENFSDAAPVAQTLAELLSDAEFQNARLKNLIFRIEL